jgi:hypothetical protein
MLADALRLTRDGVGHELGFLGESRAMPPLSETNQQVYS